MSHRVVTPGATVAARASAAIADDQLQAALGNLRTRLFTARAVATSTPGLKDSAAALRRETLADLPAWLDRAEAKLRELGVVVHRAATPADARRVILDIARHEEATLAVKSKSMATEEIDLVDALEAAGVEAVETDLGEYIVQVAGERPSHMITPAIHKTLGQIAHTLETRADGEQLPVEHEAITAWARAHLRRRFLAGDLGITGANFLAADTGTIVLVTNEGNADLCTIVPRVQIAVVPVEKVIARFADLPTLLPLLTRSATGQRISNYLTMITGPRRAGEIDGPETLHVVLLDHGRTRLLGTPYEDMLACIRCGACLNVCPVFRKISGHAYDAVYSGPMGKVLTPLLSEDGTEGRELPFASSLCGACTEACPVEIPLADLLVRLRADLRRAGPIVPIVMDELPEREPVHERLPGEGFDSPAADAPLLSPGAPRSAHRSVFRAWARAWSSPRGYRSSTGFARAGARLVPGGWTGARVPVLRAWTSSRDAPLPAPRSFRERWATRDVDPW
ncbi:MAG TPA: lactate utilization protein B [Acidimicrobiia bacterium]